MHSHIFADVEQRFATVEIDGVLIYRASHYQKQCLGCDKRRGKVKTIRIYTPEGYNYFKDRA